MMLRRFEANWVASREKADFYLLDLIAFREVSDAVSRKMSLMHQSPQLLLIREGVLERAASHSDIAGILPENT